MSREEYFQYLKEDWEFHKRHPEMFLVWLLILGGLIYCILNP